jgi:leader peptidase (prepilin peptidase)/N-methyltransferase
MSLNMSAGNEMALIPFLALPWQYSLIVFSLGISIGSFLNVVVWRLPRGEGVAAGRSHCPACGHNLSVIDLIPLLGYFFLKGRCRYCRAPISARYPLVEFATGCFFLLALWQQGLSVGTVGLCWFYSVLLAVSLIDIDYQIIPDRLLLAGLPAVVLLFFAATSPGWVSLLIGGTGGFLFLLAIVLISRGGMGGGDVKLAGYLGLCLGWKLLSIALFLGFILGGLVGVYLLIFKKKGRKDEVPFGPFLAIGGVLAALAGSWLWQWYWGFLG